MDFYLRNLPFRGHVSRMGSCVVRVRTCHDVRYAYMSMFSVSVDAKSMIRATYVRVLYFFPLP